MNYFILGATGYIGYSLCERLMVSDVVAGTMRSTSRQEKSFQKFDFIKDNLTTLRDPFANELDKVAIICFSVSSIEQCRIQYAQARKTNIEATERVATWLAEKGYHTIFLSSDQVFDGKKGRYIERDSVNPLNAYGEMKCEIEQFLKNSISSFSILRLSKVVGNQGFASDMLLGWKNAASQGKTIRCIHGNYFTPVLIDDVVKAVQSVAENQVTGIVHVCGPERISRASLCDSFLKANGWNARIVEEPIEAFDFMEKRPLDTSMVSERIPDTKLMAKSLQTIFHQYI